MRKKLVLVFILAVFLVLPSAVGAYRLKKSWHETFKVKDGAEFILENKNGSIEVRGWDRDVIEVHAEIKIKAPSKGKARKLFKKLRFDVDRGRRRLALKADLPRIRQDGFFSLIMGERTSIAISYKVKVPHRTDLELRTVNGGIDARNVRGAFELHTCNGPIELRSLGGDGKAATTNGCIVCVLEDFPEGGDLRLKTVNGGIDLRLPRDAQGKLDAKAVNGRIKLKLSLRKEIRIKRSSVKGILGNGEGEIHLRTVNGSIRLESF